MRHLYPWHSSPKMRAAVFFSPAVASLREPRLSHICPPSIIAVWRSRWKAAGGERQHLQSNREGAVWNLRKRQLPSMPVGRGSDDEEACLRHSTPPTGTLMQAACKPTPCMYLSGRWVKLPCVAPSLWLHCSVCTCCVSAVEAPLKCPVWVDCDTAKGGRR